MPCLSSPISYVITTTATTITPPSPCQPPFPHLHLFRIHLPPPPPASTHAEDRSAFEQRFRRAYIGVKMATKHESGAAWAARDPDGVPYDDAGALTKKARKEWARVSRGAKKTMPAEEVRGLKEWSEARWLELKRERMANETREEGGRGEGGREERGGEGERPLRIGMTLWGSAAQVRGKGRGGGEGEEGAVRMRHVGSL